MNMEEHMLKDKILQHLVENEKAANKISDIAHAFNLDYYFVCYCVDDIIHKGLVIFHNVTNKHGLMEDKMLTINHRGRFFLNQSGGFSKAHNSEMWIKVKTKLTASAAAISTMLIIIIGYWGVKVADKSNKVENLESEIQILKHENDSLRAIHHSLLLNGNMKGQKPRP